VCARFYSDIANDKIVLMGVQRQMISNDLTVAYEAIYERVETLVYGSITNTSLLRSVGDQDAYAFAVHTGTYCIAICNYK
jgi:hypothetical protein